MPTTAVPRRRRRPGLRALVWTLAALVLAGIVLRVLADRTVPELDGQLTVAGLHAPVEILFDRWAVPHVYARDAEDAWFVAGFLQARERLWKMELYRRAAAGRLSELFGEATLSADRRLLAIGLRKAAVREWASVSPAVRTALERHAAGVNAVTAGMSRWRRPIEFQVLGIEPELWTPVDSLSIGKLMAWRLAENRHGELVRGMLARRIGAAEAGRLMGGLPAWAPTIIGTGSTPTPSPSSPGAARGAPPRHRGEAETVLASAPALPAGLDWLATGARAGGSNSWVVAGTRTATGRPLLANDPHLGLEMPSIWYEMHLVAAGLDVAGSTIPGAPFVVIGHNQSIAWGLTNTGADVQDFYAEDVDFARKRYMYRGAWQPLSTDRVEISVRGRSEPDVYEIHRTRHGPLVATEADWEEPPVFAAQEGRRWPRPLALRWEALALGESGSAFESINRARSWDEFLGAVRRFGAPSQNFVYADTAGNIGYAVSGALPVRAQGDGSVPVPGWLGAHEWIGQVPSDRLPAVLNPPSGVFVTANAEIDRDWPGVMTRDWAAPYRTMRILERLGARGGLDASAFRAIQADTRSPQAVRILAAVQQAASGPAMKRAEPDGRTAIDRLRLWDGVVDRRPVVSLYEAFLRAVWRRTFADELEAPVFSRFFEYGLDERFVGIESLIDEPSARYWDDIGTVDRRETRDDILVLAAADALGQLRTKFGDEADWSWDRVHAAEFAHTLSAGGRVFGWFFSRGPVPVGGDSYTVNKTAVDRRSPFGVTDVSSYRQIVDVGAWDHTLAVNTTGQSGHPRSPHYFDQNPLWARTEYRSFPFSRAAVDAAKAHRLLLVP
jgi:penicillin amidase